MAKYKVGLGILTFNTEDGRYVTAVRGDVLDIPDEVAKKYEQYLFPPDHEFALPGSLIPLNEDASEEHIANYLASGSSQEIINQLGEATPALKGRLLVNERRGQNREKLIAALEGSSDATAVREAAQIAERAAAEADEVAAEREALAEDLVTASATSDVTPEPEVHVPAPADVTDASSDEELAAYLSSTNVEEVKEASVDWSAELRARALSAEQGGKGRKGVLDALSTQE